MFGESDSAETASDDLTCCGDDGECVGIDLFHLLAQADGINTVANGVDHGLIRSAEAADDFMRGYAVVQFADNICGNLFGLIGNNNEVFAAVDVIDDAVNEERLCEQTEQGEQADLYAECDKGTQTDEKVRVEKRLSDVQTGVFLEDQRHDIRTAGGSRL